MPHLKRFHAWIMEHPYIQQEPQLLKPAARKLIIKAPELVEKVFPKPIKKRRETAQGMRRRLEREEKKPDVVKAKELLLMHLHEFATMSQIKIGGVEK